MPKLSLSDENFVHDIFLTLINEGKFYAEAHPLIVEAFEKLSADLVKVAKKTVRHNNMAFSMSNVSKFNTEEDIRTEVAKSLIKYYLADELLHTPTLPENYKLQHYMNSNEKRISQQTVIDGEVIQNLNDDAIISRIAGAQNKKASLEKLNSKSKNIKAKIDELDTVITAYEKELDDRLPAGATAAE